MRTRKPAFLWTLLLAVAPVFAQEDPGLGPWRLGMSREQAVSFVEQGPYSDAASGAFEASSAPFAGHKIKATLTFGAAGLAGVKFANYEGSDWREAEKTALEVFDQFKAKYGEPASRTSRTTSAGMSWT